MPGKLEIKNGSLSEESFISLWSSDGKENHLNERNIKPQESISSVVKGGVKKLTITKKDGTVIWKGLIPSYGSTPVIIYPERATVTYKETVLVNLLNSNNRKFQYLAWVIVLILLIMLLWWFISKPPKKS